jgi:hypothetical protein
MAKAYKEMSRLEAVAASVRDQLDFVERHATRSAIEPHNSGGIDAVVQEWRELHCMQEYAMNQGVELLYQFWEGSEEGFEEFCKDQGLGEEDRFIPKSLRACLLKMSWLCLQQSSETLNKDKVKLEGFDLMMEKMFNPHHGVPWSWYANRATVFRELSKDVDPSVMIFL